MKYYLGSIDEKNGDFEYSTTIIFETDKDPNDKHDEIAKTWRDSDDGHEWDEDGGYYECDFTSIEAGRLAEITKEVYDTLTKIL